MAAGGRGERARSEPDEVPKQFRNLGGRPMLDWSLDALADAGCDPIFVALPAEMIDRGRDAVGSRGGVTVIAGGENRQDSVANGLEHIHSTRVVVHDAARPFVTARLIRDVVDALRDADCATAAVPVEDTVAEVDGDVMVATVDRSRLWRIQTPQAFVTETLKKAHKRAAEEGFVATHDAQLIERHGGKVAVVVGSADNIKLTHAGDFELADAMASRRR